VGYRFFPVLFAILIPPLIYLIAHKLTNSLLISMLIALAPAMDNAYLVHNRGAMLEAPQLFFILLSIIFFLHSFYGATANRWLIALGASSACALAIKLNSAAILLLPLVLIFTGRISIWKLVVALISFLTTTVFVWQIHFYLGKQINPTLDSEGTYGISKGFKQIVEQKQAWLPQNLPSSIKEAAAFSARYQGGVPQLDYCKEEENGSSPWLWPFGARTINYRWQRSSQGTSYLYLVANPAAWALGLLGAIGSVILVVRDLIHGRRNAQLILVIVFLLLYLTTWLAPLLLKRVFYLYHYFVPLLFSWILAAIVLGRFKRVPQALFCVIWGPLMLFFFWRLYPLTYYLPVSDGYIQNIAWFDIWDLRCAECRSSYFGSCTALQSGGRRTDPRWSVDIGSLRANYIEQSSGTPVSGPNGIEVVTSSKIQFPINKEFEELSGQVSLHPDSASDLVEIKVIVDGVESWRFTLGTGLDTTSSFKIDLREKNVLILIATKVGEGGRPSAVIWHDFKITRVAQSPASESF
ncbi:MAG: phospholipid carrier-dependent glycosyltransferase, partial [Bdellovibrionales bacterium]|nr:phospholipid carrier-dependent glycosyltransferase [Bdellovibrionales bacterium]